MPTLAACELSSHFRNSPSRAQFSYPRYKQLRDRSEVFTGIFGAHVLTDMTVSTPGSAAGRATGELVSGSYFNTLGVGAILGRTQLPEDDLVPESSPVVVINCASRKSQTI